ncbi:fibronectin type III domain-containing protein [Myxococcus llanfairpwllgwyngyllgogerychwyrndrobwllllantysiliogogogochensis]|uniref:Fibronectin type III domain-containing protein n=1 Tax=Myxococcus llanfairpwllgwyngyllgogerychwyrndrobwllllantysiliogogogochensis TaxID=2590453 RepID=A0A540WZ73_9BACT|nr:fibronectin type III domain-containing protein [Myxococcus llanfairpwllgwyngyllgogerychwyrndrobwllllantysiliogogogochensis]TQF13754.1 fibronectin type III domain-containing protein [Myxococcus llanfairpwllgwyngyllgogerychwyrndrobwllllantysiliogogogochensis]
MRSLTPAESALMLSAAGYTTWLRVRLLVGTVDVDLSSVRGHDWLLDASWTATLDAPVGTASVTLRRFVGPDEALTLSPQVVSSPVNGSGILYDPLLREGRTMRIDCMVVPLGLGKVGTWRECFYGRIEDVDVGGETITLTGRDMAGILQDINLKEERNHGNNTVGVAVQTVMNEILGGENQWAFGPYCPVDPMWQLGRFTQAKMPLMDALQDLAAQLGWDLRLRWREGHGFAFTLSQPERATTTALWFFGPESYEDLDSLVRRLTDIRNAVRIVYADANDRDAGGNAKRKVITEVNSASIGVYGERWAEIVEASTSNINTEPEARRLARAFIDDLSESALEISVTVPLWWHLELGDLVKILPDGINFDEPQELAVQSVEHTASAKGAATKLTLRGRPSTSRIAWLKREAIPGIGKAAPFTGPDAPASLVVTNTVNSGSVSFTPAATGPVWDAFEMHVSTTSGFAPSSSTFRGLSSTTRFDVTGLAPGATYYARVRGRDAKGNVGTASTEVVLSPRHVAPADWLPLATTASIVVNPDFEATTLTGAPPDGWTMANGTWGTDARLETTTVFSGSKAVRLEATSALSRIRAQRFIVRGEERLNVSAMVLIQEPGVTGREVGLYVAWYDRHGALISTTTVQTLQGVALPIFNGVGEDVTVTAPSAASYGEVIVGKVTPLDGTGATFYAIIDSVRVLILPATPGFTPVTFGPGFTADLSSGRSFVGSRIENGDRVFLRGVVALSGGGTPGTLLFTVFGTMRPPQPETFEVRTNTGSGRITIYPNGEARLEAGGNAFVSLAGLNYALNL